MKIQIKYSCLLALALGCLLVSVPVQAQTGRIEGEVRGLDGKPLAGVTIEIVRTDISMRYEVKTDEQGKYMHAGLPAGRQTRYTVRLIQDGKVVFQIPNVNVPATGLQRVDINLQAEMERVRAANPEEVARIEEERKKAASMTELFNEGMELLNQKQYEEAIAKLEAARELDPSQFAIHANLGRAYGGAKQYEKGVEAYQNALALESEQVTPDNKAAVYNNIAQLYLAMGRNDEAMANFEKAAQTNPQNAGAYYFNLGVTLYNQNQMAPAADAFRKATEVDPKRADAYYFLGMCLLSSAESKMEGGELKMVLKPGTRESFEKYLELEPKGKYAEQAKATLQAISSSVSTVVRKRDKD